ncbi:MAG TPA: hypothetical protein VN725_07235 [Rhodanobacteraceae bacterium]|nr:hypothetical protein [Rhodanobacteraceae bacterium]
MLRHVPTVALAGLLLAFGAQAAPAKHARKSRPAPPAVAATAGAMPAAASSAAPQTNMPSPAEQARINALIQYQKDLVSVLALRGDAVHLLGASLLARPLPDQPQGLSFHDLIERAAKAPNAGPGITWARLADCDAGTNACPNADVYAQLQKQVPDNAAVWTLAMDLATEKNDAAGVRAALAKAAAAKSYDDYFGVELQGVADAVGTLPPLPETMTGAQPGEPTSASGVELLIAFGVANQQPRPSLQPLLQLCTLSNAATDDALKSDCLKTARTLEWGSSPLARAVGLQIHSQLDPAAKPAVDADTRNLAWQLQNYGALGIQGLNNDQLAQQLLEAARTGGTELSLVLSSLRANNIATEAPQGWQPEQPQPAAPASTGR